MKRHLAITEKRRISEMRQKIRSANLNYGTQLTLLPTANGEPKTWRSKGFLVQEFPTGQGCVRLEICVSAIDEHGRWKTVSSVEDMQRIKRECGYGDRYGYEAYPPDVLSNWPTIRTLFISPAEMQFPLPHQSDYAKQNQPTADYEPTVLRDDHVQNSGDDGGHGDNGLSTHGVNGK